MSNKFQLQTNNTNLDALITRVNAAKDTAASLPEAGGGSGGAIETCTLEILANAPVGSSTLYWVDGSGSMCSQNFSGMDIMMGITITCVKNSFVYIPEMMFGNSSGASYDNVSWIDNSCIFVTGNATYIIT